VTPTTERVVREWVKGRTQSDIARELGVSPARIRQRLVSAAREIWSAKWLYILPPREEWPHVKDDQHIVIPAGQ
jgi:predicted RNA polymerase sigma factor